MRACLLLGSNLGERAVLLAQARTFIGQDCGALVKVSAVYETEPVGFSADTMFLNQAVLIDTALSPQSLLERCLLIESSLGRVRVDGETRYHARSMDIDILFYGDVVCQMPELTLPHPRLHQRRFALEPLAEVVPEWVHPQLGLTALELLYSLINTGGAK